MKTVLATLAVLFLLAPGSAAAIELEPGKVDPAITDGTAAREFKAAREKWLGKKIRNYRFTVERYCFCVGPGKVKITVRNGKPARIHPRPWHGPRTVPGMFRVIGQAIKRKAADLEVRYHPRLGFAKRVSIDYIAMAADDEIGYRISAFKRLKPRR